MAIVKRTQAPEAMPFADAMALCKTMKGHYVSRHSVYVDLFTVRRNQRGTRS